MEYEVYNLTLQGANPETYEQVGSKPKFWFLEGGDENHRSLFKFSRPHTGEAWSEKVAAEIAAALKLPHADIELALFSDKYGTISPSFVNRSQGEDLIHGNEILAGRLGNYDKEKIYGQSEHTMENIWAAIEEGVSEEGRTEALSQFAGYMVLDALIGNTDRHHENWGIIHRPQSDGTMTKLLAPTYDHASSLGRELEDARRLDFMRSQRLEAYVLKGRGAIFVAGAKKGENPLKLVEVACKSFPQRFTPWLQGLADLENEVFSSIIGSVPQAWMSSAARQFSIQFLNNSKAALERLIR